MNFKRFGRTANLFDYSTVTFGKYINASGEEAVSSGTGEQMLNHSNYIDVSAGTTYTFKCTKEQTTTANTNAFCWFDSSKQLISRDLFDVGAGTDTILGSAAAPTGAAYLIMNYRGLHGETAMLNEGSTSLPYQPYKDWTDTPHYIMGTDTDTITTPAVIYANDTTATVGLKGDMSQTGTPTPTTPIQPSECGERTGNLASTEQGGISATDGSDVEYNPTFSQVRSQYIPCAAEAVYMVASSLYPVQNFVAFYDSNKAYLSRTSGTSITGARQITTPVDTAYIRVSATHATDGQVYPYVDGAKIMVNSGGSSKPYEPYGYFIEIEVS